MTTPHERGWLDSALVHIEHIQRLVAGGPSEGNWLLDLCAQLPIPRQGRWLSLGCGGGEAEVEIVSRGLADAIEGIDASATAIEAARAAAATRRQDGLTFAVGDPREVSPPEGSFDVVVVQFTLHRTRDVEDLVARLERSLTPGGWLLANEYVGPSQFQGDPRALRIVEELLALLPDRLRWDYVDGRRKEFHLSRPRAFWDEAAPDEAIASERILPALHSRFPYVERRDYGGAVANPLLENIVGNFRGDDEAAATALRLLLYVERVLMREAGLGSDFAVLAATRRLPDSVPAGPST